MSEQIVKASISKVHKMLYDKYSSSQTYFYTNKINEIVKQKRTLVNIFYEDVEYLLDLQENLKRWYFDREFENKMFTFKEYYFYHQDCPRIFLKGIEDIYAKWQDKKRDLVYKKLKIVYNESNSSSFDSRAQDQKSQNYIAVSHFLLQLSEYNPYSKKYYLRVEARKEKEKKKAQEQKKNQSKRDIQSLKNDLSAMLNDISHLSQISTLSITTPKHGQKYKNQKFTTISTKKSQQKSQSISKLSNSNSLIKFNFKKNKQSLQKPKAISIKQSTKMPLQEDRRISPKYNTNILHTEMIKSKSIFSVSSFGTIKPTDFNPNSKKEQLKLNFESKKLVRDSSSKKYQTEKKKQVLPTNIIIKTKSTSKFEPRQSLQKLRTKQISVGKAKQDEFSDKKMSEGTQHRMRSLKSEFISSNKKALLTIKPTLQLQKGKRLLQIKNW